MRAVLRGGERVEEACEGEEVDVVLDATPFYAEGGGQVGDRGTVQLAGGGLLEAGAQHSSTSNVNLRRLCH